MNECPIRGCRSLETRCVDCGRLVCDRALPAYVGWISVKDLLPPIREVVLFFNGKREVRYGFFNPEAAPVNNWATDNSIWVDDLSYDEIGTATHWMPLPAPPNN